MTDAQTLGIVANAAALVAINAFHPQLARLMRRLGFKEPSEFNDRKPSRGLNLALLATLIFFVLLML